MGEVHGTSVRAANDDIWGLDAHPHRPLFATGSNDGVISIFDWRNFVAPVATFDTCIHLKDDLNEVRSVQFSPCGQQLCAPCTRGPILLLDVDTMYELAQRRSCIVV